MIGARAILVAKSWNPKLVHKASSTPRVILSDKWGCQRKSGWELQQMTRAFLYTLLHWHPQVHGSPRERKLKNEESLSQDTQSQWHCDQWICFTQFPADDGVMHKSNASPQLNIVHLLATAIYCAPQSQKVSLAEQEQDRGMIPFIEYLKNKMHVWLPQVSLSSIIEDAVGIMFTQQFLEGTLNIYLIKVTNSPRWS